MPAAAVAIPAVISAGASVGQMISGNKMAKDAKKAIDNYQRQNLVNPYEGLQVSTLGADRQREDLARAMATNANLAAMGGSRAILGLAPQMLAQQNAQSAQIAASLDEQEKQRQQLVARGNEMVQNMNEVREQQDLAGLGQMWNVGRQESMNGINNLVQTGISTANAFASMENGGSPNSQGSNNSFNPNVSFNKSIPELTTPNTGIFASPSTAPNIVGDYLRGIAPSGVQGVQLPNLANTGFNNFGMYGQTVYYSDPLSRYRFKP